MSGFPSALIRVKPSVIREGGTRKAVVSLAVLPSLIRHMLLALRAGPEAPGFSL